MSCKSCEQARLQALANLHSRLGINNQIGSNMTKKTKDQDSTVALENTTSGLHPQSATQGLAQAYGIVPTEPTSAPEVKNSGK